MNVVLDTVEYREKHNIRRNDFMDLLIDLKNGNQESSDMDRLITLNELAAQAFLFFLGIYSFIEILYTQTHDIILIPYVVP